MAGIFVEPTLVVLQVNNRKKVGFPIETPIFGDQSDRTDGWRWCHSGHKCAGGSAPSERTPPTPRIAVSKWKLHSSFYKSITGKKMGFPYESVFSVTKWWAPTAAGVPTTETRVPISPPHERVHPGHLGLQSQSGNWPSYKYITGKKFGYFSKFASGTAGMF